MFTDEVKRTSLVIRSHKNDPVVDVDPRLKWVVFWISGNSSRNFKKKEKAVGWSFLSFFGDAVHVLGFLCAFLVIMYCSFFSVVSVLS